MAWLDIAECRLSTMCAGPHALNYNFYLFLNCVPWSGEIKLKLKSKSSEYKCISFWGGKRITASLAGFPFELCGTALPNNTKQNVVQQAFSEHTPDLRYGNRIWSSLDCSAQVLKRVATNSTGMPSWNIIYPSCRPRLHRQGRLLAMYGCNQGKPS